jgi:hypothetical protein
VQGKGFFGIKSTTAMIITDEFIERGKSDNGGWSAVQVSLLGFIPFEKRWKKRAVGTVIPDSDAVTFLQMKNKHLKK